MNIPHQSELDITKGMVLDYAISVSNNENVSLQELSKIMDEISKDLIK